MIDIKKNIKNLEKYEEEINNIAQILISKANKDTLFFKFLKEVDLKYLNDVRIILIIVDALQLSDTQYIYDSYELEDIEKIFNILLEKHPSDMDVQIEAMYFNHNIMNNNQKTLKIIKKLEEQIQNKLLILSEVKQAITKEL